MGRLSLSRRIFLRVLRNPWSSVSRLPRVGELAFPLRANLDFRLLKTDLEIFLELYRSKIVFLLDYVPVNGEKDQVVASALKLPAYSDNTARTLLGVVSSEHCGDKELFSLTHILPLKKKPPGQLVR